jgi:hypothetical protein
MDALKKKRATRIANKLSNDPNVVQKLTEQLLTEHVRKVGNQYCLFSKKTGKKLGCYDSKKGVKKREKQVQYFKHAKGKKKLEEEGAANSMGAGGVQGYAGKYFKDEEF